MFFSTADVLLVLFGGLILFFEYLRWKRRYWQSKNVLCLEDSPSFPRLFEIIFEKFRPETHVEKVYQEMKRNGLKHGGAYIFDKPVYLPVALNFLVYILSNRSSLSSNIHSTGISNIPSKKLDDVFHVLNTQKKLERYIGSNKIGVRGVVQAFLKEFCKEIRFQKATKMEFEKLAITLENCLKEVGQNEQIIQVLTSSLDEKKTIQGSSDVDYTEGVILETIRLHPTNSFLVKKCNENLQIPGTDVILEKGMSVVVPVSGLHNDPDYFPDPDYFNPSRFCGKMSRYYLSEPIYWNLYDSQEMKFLRMSLETIIRSGALKVI